VATPWKTRDPEAGDDSAAGVVMRPMLEADIERVTAIETASFTTPWKAATFRTLMDRSGAVLRVLETPAVPVAGYAVLWCILDQGELANIAVAPELRNRGLGSFLLDRMTEEARGRGVESLYLEVRVSNFRARAMYGSRGFEEIGVRRDYYEKPREDARILVKRLTPTP
jgi:[ribosomal protein S18]-alanine N-acetyltransferase